ncbi:MAG: TIR domain-containing protein [Verrucomicrobiales bacterium]|nr:TIR domain-containing protein [Verrucomicrobiales bacterium]
MKNLFISYSSKDGDFVTEIETRLEEFYEVFVDRSELTGGTDWEKRIKAGIERCDVFLAVASKSADDSEWVARETLYAESLKKHRIPLLLNGELPFRLLNLQYVDFRGEIEGGMSDLLTALKPLAEPEPRKHFEADRLIGAAVRARLSGDFAKSNNLLSQARVVDSLFDIDEKQFWSTLGEVRETRFDPALVEIVENTAKVTPSRYKDHDTYQWKLRLDAPEAVLDLISHVEYQLHPSFPKQQQIIRDRESRFELRQYGWGIFPVTIQIHLNDQDTPVSFVYNLSFKAENRCPALTVGS